MLRDIISRFTVNSKKWLLTIYFQNSSKNTFNLQSVKCIEVLYTVRLGRIRSNIYFLINFQMKAIIEKKKKLNDSTFIYQ